MTHEVNNSPSTEVIADEIGDLRQVIDKLDADIINNVDMRTRLSKRIGRIRANDRGPRIDTEREEQIYDNYSGLGLGGRKLAKAILELARGSEDTTVRRLMNDIRHNKVTFDEVLENFGSRVWPAQNQADTYEHGDDWAGDDDIFWIRAAYELRSINEEQRDRLFATIAATETQED